MRHVCGVSGGKDSAALAIYLKQQGTVPEMEYYFSDTGCELPETYDFIDRLENFLGKKIIRLPLSNDKNKNPFEHALHQMGSTFEARLIQSEIANLPTSMLDDLSILPSPTNRWCTAKLKLAPFEEFVGGDEVKSYIAIRADEHREGYVSTKPNIHPVFPFIQDEIIREDVFRILEETVGIPEYYRWRSRSGCYFCFFQRREEWIGLLEHHPDLFAKALQMEKQHGNGYTWIEGESLEQLLERKDEVIAQAQQKRESQDNRSWQQKMLEEGDGDDQGCLICSL